MLGVSRSLQYVIAVLVAIIGVSVIAHLAAIPPKQQASWKPKTAFDRDIDNLGPEQPDGSRKLDPSHVPETGRGKEVKALFEEVTKLRDEFDREYGRLNPVNFRSAFGTPNGRRTLKKEVEKIQSTLATNLDKSAARLQKALDILNTPRPDEVMNLQDYAEYVDAISLELLDLTAFCEEKGAKWDGQDITFAQSADRNKFAKWWLTLEEAYADLRPKPLPPNYAHP